MYVYIQELDGLAGWYVETRGVMRKKGMRLGTRVEGSIREGESKGEREGEEERGREGGSGSRRGGKGDLFARK